MTTVSNTSSTLDVPSITSALTKNYQTQLDRKSTEIKSYELKISNTAKLKDKVSTLNDNIKALDSIPSNISSDELKTKIKSIVNDINTLKNEKTLRNFNFKLRESVDVKELSNLGVSYDKSGVLKFDETKFNENYTNNNSDTINSVKNSFNKVQENSVIFNQVIDSNYGSLNLQTKSFEKRLSKLNDEQDKIQLQKDNVSINYTTQLNNLQNYLNNMNVKQNNINNLLGKA